MAVAFDALIDQTTYVIKGKTFTDSRINLEHIRFENCHFLRCKLNFGGGEDVDFTDCSFQECEWGFDGPADNTLLYLASLYRGFGQDGKNLVEAIFQSIREGTIETGVTFPSAVSIP